MRLGFILINLSTLEFDYNQTGGLYDVISETEERYGQIKVHLFAIFISYLSIKLFFLYV